MVRVECQEVEQLGKFLKINLDQIVEDFEFQVWEFEFFKCGVEGRKKVLSV